MARAGELRAEFGGPKLPPFDPPDTTVRGWVALERKRRRDLRLEAQAIEDPDAANRETLRLLIAETQRELHRMSAALEGGRRRRETSWSEIGNAADTLTKLHRATAALAGPKAPAEPAAPVPDPAPSLVERLASQGGNGEARSNGVDPSPSLTGGTEVSQLHKDTADSETQTSQQTSA